MREAHTLPGRRDDLLCNEDELPRPDELCVWEGTWFITRLTRQRRSGGVLLDDLTADDRPTVIGQDMAEKSAELWEPWTDRLSVALVELVTSETALYDGDHLSDGADLLDGALSKFQPLPAVVPARHESAWFLRKDLLVHVHGVWWLTVRARTSAALDAVRNGAPAEWVNR